MNPIDKYNTAVGDIAGGINIGGATASSYIDNLFPPGTIWKTQQVTNQVVQQRESFIITVMHADNGYIVTMGPHMRVVPEGQSLADAIAFMIVESKIEK